MMTTSNCSSEYGSEQDGLIKSQSIRDAFDTRSFAAAKCNKGIIRILRGPGHTRLEETVPRYPQLSEHTRDGRASPHSE